MKHIAIAGAGFSGAVLAQELAQAGCCIDVFDTRAHIAGNCHTARDEATGVMIHTYGPHIFHTSNLEVWNYVQRFGEFMPFVNRVKAITDGRVYSLPLNLLTINQFFGRTDSPREAAAFFQRLAAAADQETEPAQNFEAQALRLMGRELYEAFFRTYTLKQWGTDPTQLPASILKRLPVRFDYNDNYYASTYQGIPREGYTAVVARMLDHPNITVHLDRRFDRLESSGYDHVFCSGPIDGWFHHDEGRLGYRTLDFVREDHEGDFQGNAVINYCDASVPWTRISEHKHFAPWEDHAKTVIFKEFSRACDEADTPYYPIRLTEEKALLSQYVGRARAESGVTFFGRLGTYRYIDMHVAIAEALDAAKQYVARAQEGQPMPAFLTEPL